MSYVVGAAKSADDVQESNLVSQPTRPLRCCRIVPTELRQNNTMPGRASSRSSVPTVRAFANACGKFLYVHSSKMRSIIDGMRRLVGADSAVQCQCCAMIWWSVASVRSAVPCQTACSCLLFVLCHSEPLGFLDHLCSSYVCSKTGDQPPGCAKGDGWELLGLPDSPGHLLRSTHGKHPLALLR